MKTFTLFLCVVGILFMTWTNHFGVMADVSSVEAVQGRCVDWEIRRFDYFLLALSWGKTFCGTTRSCIPDKVKDYFTIHGLWPNLATPINGKNWPQCCNNTDVIKIDQLRRAYGPDMESLWPDMKFPNGFVTNGLYAHEWSKHGTCAQMNQGEYFDKTLDLARQYNVLSMLSRASIYPDDRRMVSGSSVRSAIRNAFGGYPQIRYSNINGKKYLGEVWICFTKDFRPMDCPNNNINAEFIIPASTLTPSRRSMDIEEEPEHNVASVSLRSRISDAIKA